MFDWVQYASLSFILFLLNLKRPQNNKHVISKIGCLPELYRRQTKSNTSKVTKISFTLHYYGVSCSENWVKSLRVHPKRGPFSVKLRDYSLLQC